MVREDGDLAQLRDLVQKFADVRPFVDEDLAAVFLVLHKVEISLPK